MLMGHHLTTNHGQTCELFIQIVINHSSRERFHVINLIQLFAVTIYINILPRGYFYDKFLKKYFILFFVFPD